MNLPKLEDLERVRFATLEDEDELFEMCKRLHAENAVFPMSQDKVRYFLQEILSGRTGAIGVIGDTGCIEASICLRIGSNWYSEKPYIDEVWNYCLPEYRRSENAKTLVEFSKACAIGAGMVLMIGILSNHRTEAKIRLYERKLGPHAGAFFIYGAQTGQAHVEKIADIH